MAATLQLSPDGDLTLDSARNIAVLADPAALAQDAASAIKTFLGEYYLDVTIGVPWLQQIIGKPPGVPPPSLALIKQLLVDAALTVPGVASSQVFLSEFSDRGVVGQVQVIPQAVANTAAGIQAANFSVFNPQGSG